MPCVAAGTNALDVDNVHVELSPKTKRMRRRERLVVPCAHGVPSTGNEVVRAHEVTAPRLGTLFLLRDTVGAEVCSKGFDAPPPGYRRGDSAMARIHCQL